MRQGRAKEKPRPPPGGRPAESLSRALAEKNRLRRKLHGSELVYREIFNATTEAIAVEDTRTGRFVEVNDPMVRMYGYSSREELLACSIGDLSEAIPPFTQEEALRRNRLAVAGQPQVFEWLARKKSGELFNVEVSLTFSPIRGRNRVLAVVRDITERKLAQEALQRTNEQLEATVRRRTAQLRKMTARLIVAEEAERERIGHILHDDLQQILVGLRYQLQAGGFGSPRRKAPADVLRTLEEALRVTRSLSTDLLPPVLIAENLRAGLEWLLDDTRARFGLEVRFDMDAAAEPESEAVRVFVFHAVRELCLNIAKHAKTQSAHLNVERSDGDWIRIELRDRGSGFDATGMQPTGLGLFRIREKAGQLGGRLDVSSSSADGTRVTLRLPRGLTQAIDQPAR